MPAAPSCTTDKAASRPPIQGVQFNLAGTHDAVDVRARIEPRDVDVCVDLEASLKLRVAGVISLIGMSAPISSLLNSSPRIAPGMGDQVVETTCNQSRAVTSFVQVDVDRVGMKIRKYPPSALT